MSRKRSFRPTAERGRIAHSSLPLQSLDLLPRVLRQTDRVNLGGAFGGVFLADEQTRADRHFRSFIHDTLLGTVEGKEGLPSAGQWPRRWQAREAARWFRATVRRRPQSWSA